MRSVNSQGSLVRTAKRSKLGAEPVDFIHLLPDDGIPLRQSGPVIDAVASVFFGCDNDGKILKSCKNLM